MTTIVASFKERVMLSDSRTTDEDAGVKWPTRKIERIGASLFGAAGDCVDIDAFFIWLQTPKRRRPKIADSAFSAIELNERGIWLWDYRLKPFAAGIERHAIGSGAMAALAVLELGADARTAIEIACRIDPNSEGPIQSESL
ncbi:MAG: hypothetical protein ACK5OQ_16385 [Burkholderiales bacterium]|jgi:hypothetical protein